MLLSGTAVLDEDAMGSDSATQLATQQSIKAYVDNQVSGGDFADNTFTVYDNVDNTKLLSLETSGITTGNTRTLSVPDYNGTIATVAGTETLTNKTLTSAVLGTAVSGSAVLDEDAMGSDSATQLATQQSIKAYVDSSVGSLTSANIFVGNVSGVATDVTMSGDVAIDNAGATTIQNNAVDGTDIALGSDAQGDMMYHNGTDWARLGAGTNGQYLQTQGAGADPQWGTVSGSIADATANNNTLRWNGTSWVESTVLTNDGIDVTISGDIITADNAWLGLGSTGANIEFEADNGGEIIIDNANVGINTATPDFTLHVAGTFGVDGDVTIGNYASDNVISKADDWTFENDTTITLDSVTDALNFDSNTLSIDALNNYVGIGTASPQYTLDVIGNIRATGSVYYEGTGGSADGTLYTKPDFVFEDNYHVMTTKEVQDFIEKENHLPWLTSVKQEKQENGDTTNMTRMAFETVETAENLQMQIVTLNEKIKELGDENKTKDAELEALQARNANMEKRLARLEQLL